MPTYRSLPKPVRKSKRKALSIVLFLMAIIGLVAFLLISYRQAQPSEDTLAPVSVSSLAEQKLASMTLPEKIAQMLLVRYPDNGVEELEKFQFGGYVFFAQDFRDRTTVEVQSLMSSLQSVAKIPIITAVDEEGGSVVRISSNSQLVDHPFASPQALYRQGGFEAIRVDTVAKSQLLHTLGINLNLAPVVDVSTDPSDYMFGRTLGEDTALTAEYARTVIEASRDTGVAYTLKHFPGYGNNSDTHTDTSVDQRQLSDITEHDLPPFIAGIRAGASAVLVSHNIVTTLDPNLSASLSAPVHRLLRRDLGFEGIIITDDLAMGATKDIPDAAIEAVIAGNDLIITTDYATALDQIYMAVHKKRIPESTIDRHALRVLEWKTSRGLL